MSGEAVATTAPDLEQLRDAWRATWPEALALWSPFTRLRAPVWCLTEEDERREGLTGSFAMIRLVDQTVVVSLRQIAAAGLTAFPREILGHEIGHHILCPADLADNARMLARIRRALPSIEHRAAMIGNLFADALINDRLQRARSLDMAGVYAALGGGTDRLWSFYLRTYEILWALPTRRLVTGVIDDRIEGDAQLGARLIRSFAGRWLDGAGRYGALCLPYLLEEGDPESERLWRVWQDATAAGAGGFPDGLTEIEADEAAGAVHPALDPELNGDLDGTRTAEGRPPAEEPPKEGTEQGSPGNYREPFQYGEILRASGLDLTDHEVAMRYYRERAMGHLIPFPSRRVPIATDPLPEGVETWDVGEPVNDIDWIETVTRSPIVVPGVTTVRREWGTSAGNEPDRVPVDLDLYIDSSGSMPDPRITVSYLTLAGAIVALSALRAGANVQATLWSGTNQFVTTRGFVRDEQAVLRVMTGFFGGATAFPIHVVRDTYAARRPNDPPAHVLIVSDDGVTTMYGRDGAGRDGGEVMRRSIERAGGGATMVLNLWGRLEDDAQLLQAQAEGWDIHVVREWADLVAFARAFSRRQYDEPSPRPGAPT